MTSREIENELTVGEKQSGEAKPASKKKGHGITKRAECTSSEE